MDEEYEKWLKTRPSMIQKLMRKYRPGTTILCEGCRELKYILGIGEATTEDECTLIVSHIKPYEDYNSAIENKEYVYIGCLKKEE